MAKLKPNQFILDGHLITERPMLFQTNMVQSVLEDRKKQTRRNNGLSSINVDAEFWNRKYDPKRYIERFWDSTKEPNPNPLSIEYGFIDPLGFKKYIKCPYGKPGDLIWVRESFYEPIFEGLNGKYYYRADLEKQGWDFKWKPSIHMPKEAARIWLMIKNISVERLQDISEADAKAEGVERWVEIRLKSQPTRYKVYTDSDPEALYTSTAKDSFETLWISINGQESWNQNPWVWVIKFRVLSKTGRPSNEEIFASRISILHAGAGLASQRKEVGNV